MIRLLFLSFLLLTPALLQAQTGQIHGQTTDHIEGHTIPNVSVLIESNGHSKSTVTDSLGRFTFESLSYGIYNITLRHVSYKEKRIYDLGLYDSKGLSIDILLEGNVNDVGEVEISAYANPVEPTDPLAFLSARSISLEETKRFAGSLGDPSRMALSYAGVNSSRGDNNELIIRGNSAKYLQWKLEGMPIPNPNHFGVYGSSGGLFNILNANNLGRSTFYIGGIPAHTGNTLSGLFDLALKNGDPDVNKHSLELSLIGLSASSNGPLNIAEGGDYNINYRYSTLGLLKQAGVAYQAPEYQDLTFKVNVKTKKAGTFTFYGLGGLGESLEEEFFRVVDSTQVTTDPRGQTIFGFNEIAAENFEKHDIAVLGFKHQQLLNSKLILENSLNYSITLNEPSSSGLDKDDFSTYLKEEASYKNTAFRYSPSLTLYLNDKHTLNAGALVTFGSFDSRLTRGNPDGVRETILDHNSRSFLGQSFINYSYNPSSKVNYVAGLHYTHFSLNGQHLVEPRLSANYRLNEKSSLAFSTGLHSATDSPELYLKLDENLNISTRSIGMARSWQSVISYKKQLAEKLHLTTELYFQYLFDVPIAADSSNFSLLNEPVSFTNRELINEGRGLNYGLEVVLEKFFSNSYYFLLTGSLFQSEYRLLEPFYRKSSYSSDYVVNALVGKEFRLKQNKFLSINLRNTVGGGKPYVPIDLEQSVQTGSEVRDMERAYLSKLPAYVGVDLSFSYKWIRPKLSHELKLDIFRLFEQNYYDEVFVPQSISNSGEYIPASSRQVRYGDGQVQSTLLPVIYYKVTF